MRVTGCIRLIEVEQRVVIGVGAHVRDERRCQRGHVRVVQVPVDLAPAVVFARDIGRAVGLVPAALEERELRLVGKQPGAKTPVVGLIEYRDGTVTDVVRQVAA